MKQEKTETSIELKEGIMTNREMAEWFGCSLTTFTRNRPNWVKRLDDYCDYKLVRGGVIISNIRLSCYIKNKKGFLELVRKVKTTHQFAINHFGRMNSIRVLII